MTARRTEAALAAADMERQAHGLAVGVDPAAVPGDDPDGDRA